MTRKQPSGCAKRKRSREKKLEALRAQAADLGAVVLERDEHEALRRGSDSTASTVSPLLQSLFDRVGPPPLDPVGNVSWANGVAAALTWDAAVDGAIEPRERRRVAKDLIAVIGMTASRGSIEKRLAELEARVDTTGTQDQASATVKTSGPSLRAARKHERRRQAAPDDKGEHE